MPEVGDPYFRMLWERILVSLLADFVGEDRERRESIDTSSYVVAAGTHGGGYTIL